jgi:hypothetical protein
MARGEQAGATIVSKVLLVLPERRETIVGPAPSSTHDRRRETYRDEP